MTCVARVMTMTLHENFRQSFPEKSNSTFSFAVLSCERKSNWDYTWDSIMGWTSQNVSFRPKWVHSSHSWAILAFSPRQTRRLVILRTKSWKGDLHNWMWSLSKLQSNFSCCMIKSCMKVTLHDLEICAVFMSMGARSASSFDWRFCVNFRHLTHMLTQCIYSI